MYHTRNSLLFSNEKPWIKKGNLFDVIMGTRDGAEVCELVDLNKISKKFNKNVIDL